MNSYIIINSVYTVRVEQITTQAQWYAIINTDFTSPTISPIGVPGTTGYDWVTEITGLGTVLDTIATGSASLTAQARKIMGREKTDILVQFTPYNHIPAEGAITIEFPFGVAGSITRLYPNCRSAVTLGSTLYSNAGDYTGDINCVLYDGQDGITQDNTWYITGFQELPAGSLVIISGQIDNPAPGLGEQIPVSYITTYSNQLPASIQTVGNIIGRDITVPAWLNFPIVSMNLNTDFTFLETDVIRSTDSYRGPFKAKVFINDPILTTNTISVIFPCTRNCNLQTGGTGFGDDTSLVDANNLKCYFEIISSKRKLGCTYDYSYDGVNSIYQLQSQVQIDGNTEFMIVITQQNYDAPCTLR